MGEDIFKYLFGKWQGKGLAAYPTMTPTEYIDELKFSNNDIETVIGFEHKTWHIDADRKGKPMSWEIGFIIKKENDEFGITIASKGGRLESLKGKISLKDDLYYLALNSNGFLNDEKTTKTLRELWFDNKNLRYRLSISTKSIPDLIQHFESVLTKV